MVCCDELYINIHIYTYVCVCVLEGFNDQLCDFGCKLDHCLTPTHTQTHTHKHAHTHPPPTTTTTTPTTTTNTTTPTDHATCHKAGHNTEMLHVECVFVALADQLAN